MAVSPPSDDYASQQAAARGAALAGRLDRPLVMVGMMGTGKTALGRRLAQALGWGFVDADAEIETAAQQTIAEIFATYGEAYFRDGERRVIARLVSADDGDWRKVIATGGGAFCNAETRALVLARGLAIWLDADLDTLMARTARRDHRPLLQTGDPRATLARLAEERRAAYACAQLHITTGNRPIAGSLAQALAAIADWLDRRDAGGKESA